jgi:sugar/nucleoside kinase (ribokinase family)
MKRGDLPLISDKAAAMSKPTVQSQAAARMQILEPVCIIGGAHVDVTGRTFEHPRPGVSNPGRLSRRPGGVGLNTASTLARLGVETWLAGPIGADADGEAIQRALAERGTGDMLAVVPGHSTGTYTAIVGPDGDLAIGLADLAGQEAIDADWLNAQCGEALSNAHSWFLTANLSESTIAALARRTGGRFLAAAATSPAKAVRLKPVLATLGLLFCNQREARALCGTENADSRELAAIFRTAGVATGLISNGGRELVGWDTSAIVGIEPPQVSKIADVHGAGDALAAGTIAGRIRGMALAEAARIGIAAAQLTLAVAEPWRPDLTFAIAEARAEAIAPAQVIG